jgi:hypothetical protein
VLVLLYGRLFACWTISLLIAPILLEGACNKYSILWYLDGKKLEGSSNELPSVGWEVSLVRDHRLRRLDDLLLFLLLF